MFRRICGLFAALAVAGVALVAIALPASALSGYESDFLTRLNDARQAEGLPSLAVRSDLVEVARRQSQRQSDRGEIYHNPNLGSEVTNWRIVGENVGRGPNVKSVHQALMASPKHKANILDTEYLEVGIGTVESADGYIYVTQVFRTPEHATQPVVAAPKPAPKPAVISAPRPAPVRAVAVAKAKPAVVRKPVVKTAADPAALVRTRLAAMEKVYASRAAGGVFDHALGYLEAMTLLAG